LEVLYNREGFGFMNEEHNSAVKGLEDKRRHFFWKKEKNGDSRVGNYSYRLGMRIQNPFIGMQTI